MLDRYKIFIIAVLAMASSINLPIAFAQQPNPDSPRYKAVVALLSNFSP